MSSLPENARWFWREFNSKERTDPRPLAWVISAILGLGEGAIIAAASGSRTFPYPWYINLPLALIIFGVAGYGFGLFLFYFVIPIRLKLIAMLRAACSRRTPCDGG